MYSRSHRHKSRCEGGRGEGERGGVKWRQEQRGGVRGEESSGGGRRGQIGRDRGRSGGGGTKGKGKWKLQGEEEGVDTPPPQGFAGDCARTFLAPHPLLLPPSPRLPGSVRMCFSSSAHSPARCGAPLPCCRCENGAGRGGGGSEVLRTFAMMQVGGWGALEG